ncbi:zinc finger HIT domain-containing protein 2-like isoform X1 [Biomphalaria glabrata]|uniref:Zinc finger HIT domain-containing protein 2-like isoform X1 n=2 Tax=Biomphalaria glabrata TaxID=6526 RepID=A0A9W2ZRD0_BIOGL|nr:zinc finger HIT domain-containing protein 2-like isoform X1 [Biomphalaria glabrata]
MEDLRVSRNAERSTCKICLLVEAKYTCPRCNLSYCSVPCYQSEKHVGCSEAFYKDWVVSELKDMTNNPDDRKKVLEMLSKDLEEKANEETDDDSDDDLAVRLNGLDLDKDISTVWKRLTKKEREEFAKMYLDGRIATLIELWTPWWRSKKNNKLVTDKLEDDVKVEEKIPESLTDVPDINILLKSKRPSANLRFDLINILFSYAYVCRIHNGTHLECPVDSCQELLSISVVLNEQYSCSSIGEAIQKSVESFYKREKSSQSSSFKFLMTLLEDLLVLISGPGSTKCLTFMTAALSDLTQLLRMAHHIIKKEQKHCEELASLKSQIFKAEKKILFIMGWLQRYGMGMHSVLPLLQFEIETRQSEHEAVCEIKSAVESSLDSIKALSAPQQESSNKQKIIELT